MTRRELLAAAAVSSGVLAGLAKADGTAEKALLGGAPTAFNARVTAGRRNHQPFDVIEHCHALGLAGAEAILPSPDPAVVRAMRQKIDATNMVLILNTPLPKTDADVGSFDTAVRACKEAGAIALHAAMTGRRYEQFDSLAAFQENFAQCKRSVALAEPVLRKHRMPLAVENHKGWRAAEQAAWMKQVSSEWVGVCLDMGNNLSLCEMPDETFAALTPFAIFSHIKDMGLEPYRDGFLLSEVPFGEGVIDLKQRVAQLRGRNPRMLFCLEMITRNPLEIPVFTDKFWATFTEASTVIPGRDVARVLKLAHDEPKRKPLPRVGQLAEADLIQAEDAYNRACIDYARRNLNM